MQPGVGDHAPFDLERPFGPATAGVFPVLAEEIAVTVQRDVRPRPELHGSELFEHVRVIPAEVFPARARRPPRSGRPEARAWRCSSDRLFAGCLGRLARSRTPAFDGIDNSAYVTGKAMHSARDSWIYIDGENFQGMRQDIGDDPETWSTSCW
jgi:hypothetical protein